VACLIGAPPRGATGSGRRGHRTIGDGYWGRWHPSPAFQDPPGPVVLNRTRVTRRGFSVPLAEAGIGLRLRP
jgi:hypothetical protein